MARVKAHLDWLDDARSALNADPAFRKLGSADLKLGLSIGDDARIVTFAAFEITDVAEANPSDLRDADLVLEMAPNDWNAYLRQRAKGKGASVLSLDLEQHVVKPTTPLKRLLLERYNRTIQGFLDKGAALSMAHG